MTSVVVHLNNQDAANVLFAMQNDLPNVLPFHNGNCEALELSPKDVTMIERAAEAIAVRGRILRATLDRVLPADDEVLEFFEACEEYWKETQKADDLAVDLAYDRRALERVQAVAFLVRKARKDDGPALRPFFTIATLATYLNLSTKTVKTMLERGDIPSYKIGAARRIAADDVDVWLAARREEAKP
jgi:excisionase family DNA binding protein